MWSVMSMSSELQAFVDEAERVDVLAAYQACGQETSSLRRAGGELIGPCPVCGGRDRFSINQPQDIWNCRGSDGGRSVKLVQHLLSCEYIEACEVILGRPRPARTDPERVRAFREQAAAQSAAARAKADSEREAKDAAYREREIKAGRDIWERAGGFVGSPAERYLAARNCLPAGLSRTALRYAPASAYWHDGKVIGRYPALVAPFIGADRTVEGCHITYVDLDAPPKYRPAIVDQSSGEPLPTKKMRGAKKGRIIPLFGRMDSPRWIVGEGIETTLAVAAEEGLRAATFYAAAGDLGNLVGPALHESNFDHPSLTRTDAAGRVRRVIVAGPEPDMDGKAIPVHDGVTSLVLVADGDSERVMTASAMARAQKRFSRPGRIITVIWPPEGVGDFADWRAANG